MTPRYALITAVFFLFFSPLPLVASEGGQGAEQYEARHGPHLLETFHTKFSEARDYSSQKVESVYWRLLGEGEWLLSEIKSGKKKELLNLFDRLRSVEIEMAAVAAAKKTLIPSAKRFIEKARLEVKGAAHVWPPGNGRITEAVYSVLFGGRFALEEAFVQTSFEGNNPLTLYDDVPSESLHAFVKGVKVHSGDILLFRGDTVVQALIARGNDFPGVFSGTAMVHVDSESSEAIVIEARLGEGITKTSFGDFLVEKGYDALLLRVRPGHPALKQSPLAPKRAADYVLSKSGGSHLYDPLLDWGDDERYYGEELLLSAYDRERINLWPVRGRLTSPGLATWLHSLGVRHLDVLVPSDLEYDPALTPVAEWRNIERLRDERFNNAVFDALIDGADMGDRLGYALDEVPLALLVKAWSVIQGYRGLPEEIPDGMGPFDALRFRALTERIHPLLKKDVRGAADWLTKKQGFEPTYRQLVGIAKKVLENRRSELGGLLKSLAVK